MVVRRFVSITVLIVCLIMAAPAMAGTVNMTDGRGTWQSAKCSPPQMPEELSKNPEAAADDLNAQIAMHNGYVAASQSYMNCISQEAQADAEASSQLVIATAKNVIQQTQDQINASAARLKKR